MKEIEKIAALLHSDAPEKQVAAAIVLGELKSKSPAVTKGLLAMLESGIPPLQRHALDTLARIGVGRSLEKIFAALSSGDDDVRKAASRAIASVGTKVIPDVRRRLKEASTRERQALESVLAQLGGKEAFSALLANLHTSDEDEAKTVALEIRHQLKAVTAKTKANYGREIPEAEEDPGLTNCHGHGTQDPRIPRESQSHPDAARPCHREER
ncbi:HEAT repeat domain-containing protein [Myxococcota bacterium]